MIFYYVIRYYVNKQKSIKLFSYKINNYYEFFVAIVIVSLYVLLIFGNLLIYRILNIGSTVDLRVICNQIQFYVSSTNVYSVLADILLIFLCILCIIKLYLLCKRIFKREFIKLNLYLYHKIPNFGIISHYALYHEIFPARYIYKFFKKFIPLNSKHLFKIKMICKNFGLIIIVACLTYDLVFNRFVLSKIYYVFPFVFVYMQWQLFGSFYTSRDILGDQNLSNFYYKINSDTFFDDDDLKDLYDYILRDFTPQVLSRKDIIDIKP